MREVDLMKMYMAECAFELGDVRVFRREIASHDIQRGGRVFHVKSGIKGMADLYAITKYGGHIEIELKSARGVLSPEQTAWRDWCVAWHIPYLELRAAKRESEVETVARWIKETQMTVLRIRPRTSITSVVG